jgi:hypothetical protein
MKRIPLPPRATVLIACSLAFALVTQLPVAAQTSQETITETHSAPRGKLTTDRELVRVGAKPTLNWSVEFPSELEKLIKIIPPNTVELQEDVTMKIRVLGASFQESTTSYLKVEAAYRLNSGSWTNVFSGIQTQVKPANVLLSRVVTKRTRIDFSGRGYRDGAWLPRYNTAVSKPNIVMLRDGDAVPTTTPAFQQGLISSFLKPYINTSTKKIKIGPRDLILLYELGQTDPRASGFDLQDLVVLVTLE